ncbi:hypothetical protein SAMN04487976_11668 [Xaviernesmea oryzae]|nr:hypothetical protein SAMN04487976_11668 [Xaviernesmea oryzae]
MKGRPRAGFQAKSVSGFRLKVRFDLLISILMIQGQLRPVPADDAAAAAG